MHVPSAPTAICLVTDRLSAGMLGAYGNCWVGTPSFDRLASSALIADQMLLTSPLLGDFYRSIWQSGHESEQSGHIAEIFSDRGSASLLITDDAEVESIENRFTRSCFIDPRSDNQSSDVQRTETENFFSRAADVLIGIQDPTLVWLHTRCLAGTWDAPYAMREWYAAEDDPAPPTSQRPPHFYQSERIDPDELLGWAQAYAAEVALWDQCLGGLLEIIDRHPIFQNAVLLVMGCRGYPLGEHHSVGHGLAVDADGDLYRELLQLPCLVRLPGGQHASRVQRLLQPDDLLKALTTWCARETQQQDPESDFFSSVPPRSTILSTHQNGNWSVRTPAWFLRAQEGKKKTKELYFKPDDLWEVNDLAERCAEVVGAIEQLHEKVVSGQPAEPLDEILTNGL
ncbi:MAG: sulfatase-like hydrolase/transferase [Pirellulales bacterium]|nr:sulfatase-like hydrolase/transferase [Pirellulales bacterium]